MSPALVNTSTTTDVADRRMWESAPSSSDDTHRLTRSRRRWPSPPSLAP